MTEQIAHEKYLSILEERARRLAVSGATQAFRAVEATVALFGVGSELVGIPVECAQEIIRRPPIAPLPGMPAWIEGITQVRGEIVSAISLAKWFEVQGSGANGEYLVVLAEAHEQLGVLVDSVIGFRCIYRDEIATAISPEAERPIRAMTRDLVALLDPKRLFASADLMIGREPKGPAEGPGPTSKRTP